MLYGWMYISKETTHCAVYVLLCTPQKQLNMQFVREMYQNRNENMHYIIMHKRIPHTVAATTINESNGWTFEKSHQQFKVNVAYRSGRFQNALNVHFGIRFCFSFISPVFVFWPTNINSQTK